MELHQLAVKAKSLKHWREHSLKQLKDPKIKDTFSSHLERYSGLLKQVANLTKQLPTEQPTLTKVLNELDDLERILLDLENESRLLGRCSN